MNRKRLPLLAGVACIALFSIFQPAACQDLTNDKTIDLADVQAFLQNVANQKIISSALDLNGDGAVDLKDALLFGQWVTGLWHDPSRGFSSLYLSNQADTAAYAAYRKNLNDRKNVWTAADLKSRYPDNTVKTSLNYSNDQVAYLDSMAVKLAKIELQEFHRVSNAAYISGFTSQVLKNGMAVDGAMDFPNFYTAFDAIHSSDLPVIFTTDALLQTVYQSYDNILLQLETNRFSAMLETILKSSLAYCNKVYDTSAYAGHVRDYLSTGLFLLNPARSDITKSTTVARYLAGIDGQGMGMVAVFDTFRIIDFSQFKPRGHYTQSTLLSNYFKAMMWLSRADLGFSIAGSDATVIQRKASLVLWDCVVNSGTYPLWLSFNRYIEFMVGTSDGLSIKGLGGLVHDLGGPRIPDFVRTLNRATFDSVVVRNSYGIQLILSQGKVYDPHQYDSLGLSQIVNFMPQRFIIDSYTFSQLVFPLVDYRELPSSMDIAFVLGDNSALGDHPDLSIAAVPGILGSQRQLYDEISGQGWQSNLYTSWLYFLRTLNGAQDNAAVSPVFRTSGWRAKMRNTQLASWAQLRHNTILYAKQSYTGMISCEYPLAYVEPYPEFFAAVGLYAEKGKSFFAGLDPQVAAYFAKVADICGKLKAAADLTAQGKPVTPAQYEWLRQVVTPDYVSVGCGSVKIYAGWYFDLIYDINTPWRKTGVISSNATIADVHTKPADEVGPAKVLHVATGRVNLMAAVIDIDSCKTVFLGPVSSYYDVITTDPTTPQRLTDETWSGMLDSAKAGPRPSWAGFLYK
jgi:hypothetical protein